MAVGRTWHPEHFICALCHRQLTENDDFHEKDGVILCRSVEHIQLCFFYCSLVHSFMYLLIPDMTYNVFTLLYSFLHSLIHTFVTMRQYIFMYSLIPVFTYFCIHSFMYLLIPVFTHSCIHSLLYSLIHVLTHSYIQSLHSFLYSLIPVLIPVYTHSCIQLFMYSVIPSFTQSCIHSFIHSLQWSSNMVHRMR